MPRLTVFDGLAPKIDPQDMRPNGAVIAENCELYGGRIDPVPAWGNPGTAVTVEGAVMAGAIATLYRAGTVWVGFAEHTFVAPDPSERAGEDSFLFVRGGKLWRSSSQWILDGDGPVLVGIEPPAAPPTPTVMKDGGSAVRFPPLLCDAAPDPNNILCNTDSHAPEARAYLMTYVTVCEEESAPSPPSTIVDVLNGDAVVLLDPNTPPPNAVARRWYRAIAGQDGLAMWLFVEQTLISAPGFLDDVPALQLGEVLTTEDHLPPPACLDGVAVLGDAMTLVWLGDQFWMSEPRLPHAYPPLWRKRVRFPILSVLGTTASFEGPETFLGYVATTGTPYYLSGVGPENVTPGEYSIFEPGASPHCATAAEGAMVYASVNGLIELSGTNASSILAPETTEIEWQDFDPARLKLVHDGGRLWGFAPDSAFVLPGSRYREDRGRYLTTLTQRADAVFASPDTVLTVAKSGAGGVQLQQWGTGTGVQRSRWRSRVFTMPGSWWPAAVKVVADFPRESSMLLDARKKLRMWEQRHGERQLDGFLNANPTLRRFEPELSSMRGYVTLRLFVDGVEYYSRVLHASTPVRVPARRGIDWQIEVGGDVSIRELHFETSIQDLVQLGLGVGNSV